MGTSVDDWVVLAYYMVAFCIIILLVVAFEYITMWWARHQDKKDDLARKQTAREKAHVRRVPTCYPCGYAAQFGHLECVQCRHNHTREES